MDRHSAVTLHLLLKAIRNYEPGLIRMVSTFFDRDKSVVDELAVLRRDHAHVFVALNLVLLAKNYLIAQPSVNDMFRGLRINLFNWITLRTECRKSAYTEIAGQWIPWTVKVPPIPIHPESISDLKRLVHAIQAPAWGTPPLGVLASPVQTFTRWRRPECLGNAFVRHGVARYMLAEERKRLGNLAWGPKHS